jgi:hypothetical protein
MKSRLVSAALVAALSATFALVPMPRLSAQANQKRDAVVIPFSAPATNNALSTTVTGTLSINKFVAQNGALLAIGTLAATVPDANGVHTVVTEVTVPVTAAINGSSGGQAVAAQPAAAAVAGAQPTGAQAAVVPAVASCGILHLVLGPLDVNVLGLVVHLDQVVLDVSAQPGSGNLLGNLLCSLAGILDGNQLTQVLNQVVNLLNQLLAAL